MRKPLFVKGLAFSCRGLRTGIQLVAFNPIWGGLFVDAVNNFDTASDNCL